MHFGISPEADLRELLLPSLPKEYPYLPLYAESVGKNSSQELLPLP
jgi:hypothetical protein